jgi:hypothetical protein
MLQPLQRLLVGPCLEVLAESERPILHLVSVLRAKSDSPHQHTPSCFLGRIASKSGGLISYATARRSHLVLHCLPNKNRACDSMHGKARSKRRGCRQQVRIIPLICSHSSNQCSNQSFHLHSNSAPCKVCHGILAGRLQASPVERQI